ncbi:MAG: DUF59 domain-containing protein [Alphaproteobacteria bacterium]|nr:DUF59 domain-containing protein [Alphaproteobacteria bacterium]
MELKPQDLEKITLPDIDSENSAVPNYSATVGTPLEQGSEKATKEDIVAALKAVQDPELMMNIYELGLVYDITQFDNGDVKVLMTLTSPTCPIAGEMPTMAAVAVASVPGVGLATVELTFDPPWTIDRLSDEIKLLMGFD